MKNMFYILAISIVIFSGCNFGAKKETVREDGELVVNNQSSVSIKEIKFCSKQLYYTGEGTDSTNSVLPIGKKTSTELTDEETGYVFFTLISEGWNVIETVRTNEIITVEKGKRFVLTITDNTLVIPIGYNEPSTLLNLVTPAILKVINNSSHALSEVKYEEDIIDSYFITGESRIIKYYGVNTYSGYVYFKFFNKRFQIEEEVTIEKGKVTTLNIVNDSNILINTGKAKTCVKLSEIEGHGLVVINSTSYDLYSVVFSIYGRVQCSKDMLEKTNSWYAGFPGWTQSGWVDLSFTVRTSDSTKTFILDDGCWVDKDVVIKEIVLSDDTVVRCNGSTGKLQIFLN